MARMLVVAVAMNPQNGECDDAVAELEKQGLTVRLQQSEHSLDQKPGLGERNNVTPR
jgi:hypothetical protein